MLFSFSAKKTYKHQILLQSTIFNVRFSHHFLAQGQSGTVRDSQGQYPVLSHNPNPNWELCT